MDDVSRYDALPADVRATMENRFMWAVSTGPSHPDATLEKAVETIVSPLLDHQHQGAVEEVVWLRAVLGRIAAGHAHPSKLAGEAVDESVARIPAGGQ